ncbi:MAG: bifunctional phosphoribosyl-AMP cyclohydrolase/phosphoribosyl-ATP diphosphatase HisIE [Clostridia bacterium]|nr:bifunctional phosphoribosyl-AMP cyclohydrolase/phosphoribosyl-ATP diphosphatase HisIE [Clostridia bacterium]
MLDNILKEVKFDDKGLVPVITQDARTDEVLMMAYANKEAVEKTLETGKVHYWSRSRSKLWLKGETSGHFQHVKSIALDCDGDTLLIKAEQKGAACHTGHHSCFYRKLDAEGIKDIQNTSESASVNESASVAINENSASENGNLSDVLKELYNTVADRKVNPKEGSYTNYLFEKGIDKILKKVGEEAAEVIIAAKGGNSGAVKSEIADLVYHLFVLMAEQGLSLEELLLELKGRR